MLPEKINRAVAPLSNDIKGDEELVVLFLENKRQRSENTYRNYKMELERFFNFIGYPSTLLSQVTFKRCLAYREGLKAHVPTYADATVARKLNIVSSLFKFGVKIRYLEVNPMEAVIRPKVQVTTQHRYLTKEEVSQLLDALKPHRRNHLIGVLLLATGLRAGELVGIRWCDFFRDLSGHIGLEVIRKRNKKGVVKITPAVWQLIKTHRIAEDLPFELNTADTSYLFTNRYHQPLSDRYVRKMLKATAFKAGIQKSISTHWLRHTSASMAINGGADIKMCMASYGWEHMQTAQRYIHDLNQLEKTAADFIDIDL